MRLKMKGSFIKVKTCLRHNFAACFEYLAKRVPGLMSKLLNFALMLEWKYIYLLNVYRIWPRQIIILWSVHKKYSIHGTPLQYFFY